ncbi:hypothetical protein D3C72_1380550 [compost metagenome]
MLAMTASSHFPVMDLDLDLTRNNEVDVGIFRALLNKSLALVQFYQRAYVRQALGQFCIAHHQLLVQKHLFEGWLASSTFEAFNHFSASHESIALPNWIARVILRTWGAGHLTSMGSKKIKFGVSA